MSNSHTAGALLDTAAGLPRRSKLTLGAFYQGKEPSMSKLTAGVPDPLAVVPELELTG